MRLAALILGAFALSGSAPAGWGTLYANGVGVRVPPGWSATASPLTPVTWPAQVLAVASFPLPQDARGADGCEPKAALDRLPPGGAFLFGWEYVRPSPFGTMRLSDFPPRPRHFTLRNLATYECMGRSYLLRFRAAGRLFQVHVALGRRATAAVRADVLRVLDSFTAARR